METPIAIRHDAFCPSSVCGDTASIGESFAVPPHKTVQEACQPKPEVSYCEYRGSEPMLLAGMPYGGRCPNVGTLQTSPRAKAGPDRGPSMVGSASVSVVGLGDVQSPHFVLQRCTLQPETFRSRSRT